MIEDQELVIIIVVTTLLYFYFQETECFVLLSDNFDLCDDFVGDIELSELEKGEKASSTNRP